MSQPDFQFLRTEPVDLKRYLPAFLYLSPEFKALQDSLQKEHERQRQVQIDVARQFHAETATWGMASWERMLGINVDTSVDLETRRASVLAKMGKPPTVTPAFLTRMINLFTTVAATQIVEHPSEYTVDIYLPDSGTRDFERIDNTVKTYLPAHLGRTYHFKTHLDAAEYMGAVIHMASRGVECGLLAHDEVLQTVVLWSVDTPVFQVEDDAIHLTELGLKMNPVWSANTSTVSPATAAPVGATDGLWYVAGDGTVKQKAGDPAVFTRASTAVLGGRTYQANEPRFTDNGLLFEPTTTNLAAAVIDVTNASLTGWKNQMGQGTFELLTAQTYNHDYAIHLKDVTSGRRIYFTKAGLTPGTSITFSCAIYIASGSAFLRMERTSAPWDKTTDHLLTPTGKWVSASVSWKVPSNGAVNAFLAVSADSEAYFDNVQLELRPYATSFTPTSRDASERLAVSEWVVNKPQWTCEFAVTLNDKQINYERPVLFGMAGWDKKDGGKMFRYETSTGYSSVKGRYLADISVLDQTLTTPHRNAITFNDGIVTYYHDGKVVYSRTETSGDKVLSAIWMGNCLADAFNGSIKNFRFSSTVHSADKIAADAKLDTLPVENDTVLYMPLKSDLSMYGHYNE